MRSLALRVGGASCVALFVFAFVAAPRSCAWGLESYFWSGVGCIAGGMALPYVLDRHMPGATHLRHALLLACMALVTWIVGLFAADFQLLCRLF